MASSAGAVQCAATAKLLARSGYVLWDLGMELPYKTKLGAQLLPRDAFLKRLRQARAVGALRLYRLQAALGNLLLVAPLNLLVVGAYYLLAPLRLLLDTSLNWLATRVCSLFTRRPSCRSASLAEFIAGVQVGMKALLEGGAGERLALLLHLDVPGPLLLAGELGAEGVPARGALGGRALSTGSAPPPPPLARRGPPPPSIPDAIRT